MTAPDREYSRLEGFAFFVAMIGVQLSSELFSQWGTYFYSPSADTGRTIYVAIGIVAFMFVLGRVVDTVVDPFIGLWSDKAQSAKRRVAPAGRRRPFVFWGSILMTCTMIGFWYPPVAEASRMNFVFGTAAISLHWAFFSLAYIPLLAMAPEVARSGEARVRLGTWIAAGMAIGLALAAVLPGVLIDALDPARRGASGEYSAAGYQRVATIFAVVSLACFQFFVWTVRERPVAPGEARVEPALREMLAAFRLPLFRLYFAMFFLYYAGVLAAQRVLPYWVELGLEGDESTVSIVLLPFVVTCIAGALLSRALNRWLDLKWLLVIALGCAALALPAMYLVGVLDAPASTKTALGAALFAVNGFGTGITYVLMTPMLGHIIDRSAVRDGVRREALFNALHNVMYQVALVLGIVVAVTSMNVLGNSPDRPGGVLWVGPIGGLFCMAALVLGLYYPLSGRGPGALKD